MDASEVTGWILDEIADFFIETIPPGRFNGTTAKDLLEKGALNEAALKKALSDLISNGAINCTFASYDINIHIKRMPSLAVADRLSMP